MAEVTNLTALIDRLANNGAGNGENKKLPPATVAKPIPPRAGASGPVVKNKRGASGGIAGPLVEGSYAARTFHADAFYTTTDGIFTVRYKPIATVTMADANGESVVLQFKAPT